MLEHWEKCIVNLEIGSYTIDKSDEIISYTEEHAK